MAVMGAEVTEYMPAWSDRVVSQLGAMKIGRRLPAVAMVLMVLLLAQSLATLTWDLLPRPEVEEKTLMTSAGNRAPQDKGRKYKNQIQQISQWHLFGEVQKQAPVTAKKVIDAPDTRLNVKLRGVMASSDPEAARAIIADGKGAENSYGVGKSLPGNAILREIYADRVIIEYRGRLETLRLPRQAEVVIGFDAGKNKRSFSADRVSPRVSRSSTSVGVNTVRNSQTSTLLRQYRDALVNDPQSLMSLVSAAPVTEAGTGRLKGYRIGPGKDKTLLRKFGLENGDVITAVNGVALDNPIKALEIMRELSTASSVSLDVERKGIAQSLSFQVE